MGLAQLSDQSQAHGLVATTVKRPMKLLKRSPSGRWRSPLHLRLGLSGREQRLTSLFPLILVLVSCGYDGTGPAPSGFGSEGGIATLAGGSVTLAVPGGALSTFVEFTAVQTDAVPTSDLLVTGSTYEIGPSGTTFNRPATLTLAYDPANIPSGVGESEIRLYEVVGSSWRLLIDTSVDTINHTVSGAIESLGRFGVLGLPVTTVFVSPSSYAMTAGETKQLFAVGTGPSGEPLSERRVTWTSSTDSVATVDSLGWVTAVGVGLDTITASVEALSSFVTIRVYGCSAQSEVSASECLALITVYDALTQGDWRDADRWVSGPNPCDWGGVTCTDGSVTGLALSGQQQLTGSIPSSIGDLSNLRILSLSIGRLNGPIPSSIGTLTKLEYLSLASNELSGAIPPQLGQLTNLTELRLYSNLLSGSIPPELGSLSNLTYLRLNGNQLSGPIPPELGNLSSLVVLHLLDNRLSGSIPSELGGLTNLESLSLSVNELSGRIPRELGNLSSLSTLGLTRNQLSGPIPPELGSLSELTLLLLWENQLTGPIPLPVAQLGAMIQANYTVPDCKFLPPGNTGLSMPDTQDFRDADLDADGKICYVTIGSG